MPITCTKENSMYFITVITLTNPIIKIYHDGDHKAQYWVNCYLYCMLMTKQLHQMCLNLLHLHMTLPSLIHILMQYQTLIWQIVSFKELPTGLRPTNCRLMLPRLITRSFSKFWNMMCLSCCILIRGKLALFI